MSMAQKRFRQACGIVAALGFLLILGTAGASDYDLIPMSQILRQGCIGLGMFAGGLCRPVRFLRVQHLVGLELQRRRATPFPPLMGDRGPQPPGLSRLHQLTVKAQAKS